MEQENIQKDTPQGTNEEQYESLEDAVFSGNFDDGSGNISDVFTEGSEGSTNQEAALVQEEQAQPSNQPQVQSDNDETRYQYWQSQADKLKNENAHLKAQQQQVAQQPVQPAQPVESNEEQFPDAPPKPERPRTFTREEAMADPNSESAKYLDEVEEWRDDMVEYTSLKNDYGMAMQQEKMQAYEQQRVDNIKRSQASQKISKQKNDLADYVIGNHGFNENEAVEFVNQMSDPASINVDNLVQLYRLNKGQPTKQTTGPAQPSQEFKQIQNAQQVPSPMGVMPSGQANSDNRSTEDKIIDKMVGDFNSKNPWK